MRTTHCACGQPVATKRATRCRACHREYMREWFRRRVGTGAPAMPGLRDDRTTPEEVREMRALRRQGSTLMELAQRFRRSRTMVSLIVTRRAFKDVE